MVLAVNGKEHQKRCLVDTYCIFVVPLILVHITNIEVRGGLVRVVLAVDGQEPLTVMKRRIVDAPERQLILSLFFSDVQSR